VGIVAVAAGHLPLLEGMVGGVEKARSHLRVALHAEARFLGHQQVLTGEPNGSISVVAEDVLRDPGGFVDGVTPGASYLGQAVDGPRPIHELTGSVALDAHRCSLWRGEVCKGADFPRVTLLGVNASWPMAGLTASPNPCFEGSRATMHGVPKGFVDVLVAFHASLAPHLLGPRSYGRERRRLGDGTLQAAAQQ